MKTLIRNLFLLVLLLGAYACTSDSDLLLFDENGVIDENGSARLKSISSDGQIKQKFIYDSYGRIIEHQSLYLYNRYSYNQNGRLEKIETAVDASMASSLSHDYPKTELMTSANSTIGLNRLFIYEKDGRLSKIENYSNANRNHFELTSINSFEYEGSLICRENYCDEKGEIGHFYEYTYNTKGNIIKEKYYSNFYSDLSYPYLMSETTYKYDNCINPLQILKNIAPSFWMSANNMTEMTTQWFTHDPRTEKSTQTFKYNNKGYPIKMIYDGGEDEYSYYTKND